MGSQLLRRSACVHQEPPKLRQGTTPARFGYVGRNGECGAHELIRALLGSGPFDPVRQLDGFNCHLGSQLMDEQSPYVGVNGHAPV
jgi:hypothetical protein